MAAWTVHAPPGAVTALAAADDLVFVREGFVWSAFVVPPIWAIARRQWLALACWVAAVALIGAASQQLGAAAGNALVLLLNLWFGLEANSIRRARLAARGWELVGVVEGKTLLDAETRYFVKSAGETFRPSRPPPPPPTAQPPLPPRAGAFPPVVGFYSGERT